MGIAILGVAGARIFEFRSMEGYDPGQLDIASTKLALVGAALFVTEAQVVSSSFFLSLFSIEPVSDEAEAPSTGSVSLNLNLVAPRTEADAAAALRRSR